MYETETREMREKGVGSGYNFPNQISASFCSQETSIEDGVGIWTARMWKELLGKCCCYGVVMYVFQCQKCGFGLVGGLARVHGMSSICHLQSQVLIS